MLNTIILSIISPYKLQIPHFRTRAINKKLILENFLTRNRGKINCKNSKFQLTVHRQKIVSLDGWALKKVFYNLENPNFVIVGFNFQVQDIISLTNTCMQYVQINPIANVANRPKNKPALRKANGIARIPVPKLPFNRWINVSKFLQQNRQQPYYLLVRSNNLLRCL